LSKGCYTIFGWILLEDKELVLKYLNGDENSFNLLARKHQKNIYWHALRMTGNYDDAMEITQQVLLLMYNKLSTFKFNSALSTWIYKITHTRSLNLLRKNNLKRLIRLGNEHDFVQSDENIFKSTEAKEKVEIVLKQLQKLPKKQREVFILKNFEDMKYSEISEITGQSVGALKANYFHALKKIIELTDEI
jgi:RNA polymerase sigma factor (sigma-70 family)